MDIPKELVDQIVQKKCVVFVGSGLSNGVSLSTWSRLLYKMLDLEKDPKLDMVLASDWHDDPDISHTLEDRAANGTNEDVGKIAAQAMLHYGIQSTPPPFFSH